MAINREKYYNSNAGKNIGRDSLETKEGAQQCNIPRKLREIINQSENPEKMVTYLIDFAKLLKEQRSPSTLPIPQEKSHQ